MKEKILKIASCYCLLTDEAVEFEKSAVEVQDSRVLPTLF